MRKFQVHSKKIILGISVVIILGVVLPVYCKNFNSKQVLKQISIVAAPMPEISRDEMLITIDDTKCLYGKIFCDYTSGYGSDMKILENLNLGKNNLKQNIGEKLENQIQGNSFYQLKGRDNYDYLLMKDYHTGEISLWKWMQGTDGQSMKSIWEIVGVNSEKDISKVIIYPTFYEEKEQKQVKEIDLSLEDIKRLYEQISHCRGQEYDFADEDSSEEFLECWDVVITTKEGFEIELTYNKRQVCFFQRSLELEDAKGIRFDMVNSELSEWLENICHLENPSKSGVFRRTKYKQYYDMIQKIPVKNYSEKELQKNFEELSNKLDSQENTKLSQAYDSIEILKEKKCILILLKEQYKENKEIQSAIRQLINESDMLVIK